MTQLLIDVVDISGGTHPDDKVRLWAPQHRPDGERVVSTSPVDVKLVDGQATIEVLPGPARVQIMTQGVVDSAPKRVTIPDEASVTLRAVIEDGLEWEPEVISRVAALTSRAESAATRAETVADTFGSLEGVATSVQAAEDAAASATGSAAAAASSATAANDSQVSAAGSATAAAQSAVNAANSEWVAGEHKGAAEAAAAGAALSADAAAVSAGQAAASAAAADDAAGRAEGVAESTHWQGDRLSVMGQLGPSLTGPKGDPGPNGDPGDPGPKGDPGEDGTGFTILGSVPSASSLPTGASPGDGYLAEDTGRVWVWSGAEWVDLGTIQGPKGDPGQDGASTWEAIQGKPTEFPPTTHTHIIEQVDGLEEALATAGGPPVIVSTTPPEDTDAIWVNPDEVPPTPGGGTTAWGDIQDKPDTYPPDSHNHPEYATAETVNARPATWLWDGVEPWVPPDSAVAGDVVLNLSTGAITTAVLP